MVSPFEESDCLSTSATVFFGFVGLVKVYERGE